MCMLKINSAIILISKKTQSIIPMWINYNNHLLMPQRWFYLTFQILITLQDLMLSNLLQLKVAITMPTHCILVVLHLWSLSRKIPARKSLQQARQIRQSNSGNWKVVHSITLKLYAGTLLLSLHWLALKRREMFFLHLLRKMVS